MTSPAPPARISLLRALDAPYIVVLRRKPSKLFHVMRWNTETDELEAGSWFYGKLYDYKCDVSFDGQWLVYFAMGHRGLTWTGVCRLPFLKTVAEEAQYDTWGGGGTWGEDQTLVTSWSQEFADLPITIVSGRNVTTEEGERLFGRRILADWQGVPGTEDPKWGVPDYEFRHPTANYTLYNHRERIEKYRSVDRFAVKSETLANPLDDKVDAAQLDSIGNLVFSREGILYRYSPEDLERGEPGSVHDLESLTPPEKPSDGTQ